MIVASSGHPTRRIVITVGISFLFHAAVFVCLRRPVPRPGGGSVVAVTVATATARRTAAPPTTGQALAPAQASSRGRHSRRATAFAPAPAPSGEPLLPGSDVAADDGDTSDAAARFGVRADDAPPPPPPAPETAPTATVAPAGRPTGASGSGYAEIAAGPTDGVAAVPSLDHGSCTEHLEYPAEAMRLGRQGVVRLIISLDEHGRVLQAKVTGKAGYGFDEAAVEAVKTRCRFSPARDAFGKPIPALVEHLFYFRIGDFRHRYDRNE